MSGRKFPVEDIHTNRGALKINEDLKAPLDLVSFKRIPYLKLFFKKN